MKESNSRPKLRQKIRILIIEDDVALTNFLRRQLESEGYEVMLAHDGSVATEICQSSGYHLVILDLNLPGSDGLSFLRFLRDGVSKIPVLVLTGRSRVEDRVQSLDSGADDYLQKPFSIAELSARIRALLRRNEVIPADESKIADLVLNRNEFRVERSGIRLELTSREFALLEYLLKNAGRPVSRAELMDKVWDQPFDPATNLVDVYIKYVRDKVDTGHELKLIRTVRGLGYMISDEC